MECSQFLFEITYPQELELNILDDMTTQGRNDSLSASQGCTLVKWVVHQCCLAHWFQYALRLIIHGKLMVFVRE